MFFSRIGGTYCIKYKYILIMSNKTNKFEFKFYLNCLIKIKILCFYLNLTYYTYFDF